MKNPIKGLIQLFKNQNIVDDGVPNTMAIHTGKNYYFFTSKILLTKLNSISESHLKENIEYQLGNVIAHMTSRSFEYIGVLITNKDSSYETISLALGHDCLLVLCKFEADFAVDITPYQQMVHHAMEAACTSSHVSPIMIDTAASSFNDVKKAVIC